MLDLETFLEFQAAVRELSDPAYQAQLLEARQEIHRGDGVDAEEAFRRKGL